MENNSINIYIGGELANLYETGYLLTDLYQIYSFSKLIQDDLLEDAHKYFGVDAEDISRYENIILDQKQWPKIVEVKNGSIEIIIAVSAFAASIIMPLLAIAVNRHLNHRNVGVTFEVSPSDLNLKKILDKYEDGEFGKEKEGFELLTFILTKQGYDINYLAANAYLVEHVIDKYSRRVVRTIMKNR